MYISHKSNVIQQVHDTEWQCRRMTKELTRGEYSAWLDSITTVTGTGPDEKITVDYSGETGYTIVKCIDEDARARLIELGDYISGSNQFGGEAPLVYNIKWQDDIGDAEELLDAEGKNVLDEDSEKTYVQSHFVPDDSAKDARILADEWTLIRKKRDRLIAETDWMTCSDSPAMSDANKTYRQKLRDLPKDQKDKTKFSDITWPSKPS